MRHNRAINHLGRKSEHRQAMLSNMASSLILHKRIATTLAKARALRKFVEPLITKSKEDSTHSRRVVFSTLGNKQAVTELFREISQKVADRPGGYTRILKTGNRPGDNADMCIIELVDFNELMLGTKEAKSAKTSRRRRGAGKKAASEPQTREKKQETKATVTAPAESPAQDEADVVSDVAEEPANDQPDVQEPETGNPEEEKKEE